MRISREAQRAGRPARVEPPSGQSGGFLDRGDLAPFLYHLGQAHATGVLELLPPVGAPAVLRVAHGFVVTGELDPVGRIAARSLAALASARSIRYRLVSAGRPDAPGSRGRPLHLSAWARSHIEAQLDAQRARQLLSELTGPWLSIGSGQTPAAILCDEIDRRILAAMQAPRPLHEIWRLARTSRFRLLSFLYFLRAVGALRMREPAADAPRAGVEAGGPVQGSGPVRSARRIDPAAAARLLGVAPGADRDAIRRAYHRRARALHPDLHPGASEGHRRKLERALAAVTAAYEQLVASGH